MSEYNDRIYVKYQYQVVHVTTNCTLIELLRSKVYRSGLKSYDPARLLSRHIHRVYREHNYEELKISEHSLGLEILIHVVAFLFCDLCIRILSALGMTKSNRLIRLFDYVKDHAEIIDCGEKAQDNNRFVFDWCAYVWPLCYPFFRFFLKILPVPKEM